MVVFMYVGRYVGWGDWELVKSVWSFYEGGQGFLRELLGMDGRYRWVVIIVSGRSVKVVEGLLAVG